MTITRNLIIIFTFFYLVVVFYLILFFLVPDIQRAIITGRNEIASLTEGPNYLWALLISLFVCFIGSASIGFPIPFPFVLFSLSNSIYLRYKAQGLLLTEILMTSTFWLEILGIAIAGGIGCALGEITSFLLGKGAKKITEKRDSITLQNVKGFGRLILENPKRTYLYIFTAAALPIPDDPLWIALGMIDKTRYNLFKCIIAGWLGKNITTMFYCTLPILLLLGFNLIGMEFDVILSVVNEAIMLLVTLTVMLLIFAFDWNKLLENREKRKQSSKS